MNALALEERMPNYRLYERKSQTLSNTNLVKKLIMNLLKF